MSNIYYLPSYKDSSAKKFPIKVKRVLRTVEAEKPAGVFIMSWDKNGKIAYYSTHSANKQDKICMGLMKFVNSLLMTPWDTDS